MLRKLLASTAGLLGTGALIATLALGAPAPASAAPSGPPTSARLQQGLGEQQGKRGDRVIALALVRATSEATGLTNKEVLAAVQGGQSLAQVAAANGSSGDAVVGAVTAKAKERLDRQVRAGHLSQRRADELLRRLTERATALVNDADLGARIAERKERAQAAATLPALVRATSEATGLPAGDIVGRLRDGESLRQIIEAAGGDPAAVLDAANAGLRAAAEKALDATR